MLVLKDIFYHFLNFLYPPACRKCSILIPDGHVVCEECFTTITSVASKTISCGRYDVKVYSASSYDGIMRKLVCSKLYGDKVAGVDLARMIIIQGVLGQVNPDCFVPIPLHWTRYAYRGFNQASVIAHKLGDYYNVPVHEFLNRTRRTSFQSHLLQSQRETNVKGVFALKTKKFDLKDKHVVIVDDLMTTGSTIKEAVRSIALERPVSISAIVACRAK
jgi:ComF family protein